MAIEANAGLRKILEDRRRIPLITIVTHPLGAERVDQDEENIDILPVRQIFDILYRAEWPELQIFLILRNAARLEECEYTREHKSDEKGSHPERLPILVLS